MPRPEFQNRDVEAVFETCATPLRLRLMQLRRLIFDVASSTPGVGRVEEALRWGQASYLTPETGSGSTIRIGAVKGKPGHYAMFFHCQSGLVENFRELYGARLTFEGKRSVILSAASTLPIQELRHCIALALTHHLKKKAKLKV